MKKKKLNLSELKVQSFVTSFDGVEDKTKAIKGGDTTFAGSWGCQPHSCDPYNCDPTGGGTCGCGHTEYTPSGCGTDVCTC